MSTFTPDNIPAAGMPGTGMSVKAMSEFVEAYNRTRAEMSAHINENLDNDHDPHKIKAYINNQVNVAKNTANAAKSLVTRLERIFIGDKDLDAAGFGQTLEEFANKKLDNQSILQFITALVNRMEALEAELNTLSLLQFDNVPVGAGIRWWKETLPEDGTYVWANGQTLYGVNQNFPELARVWEISGTDNIKVPKEDHTIFKVRKATRKITKIDHAFIDEVEVEEEPSGGD